MSDKPRFPAAVALEVARELCQVLKPCCEWNAAESRPFLCVAGSLRRKRETVGDVEILFVGKWGSVPDGLFSKDTDLAEHAIERLVESGILAKRLNSRGSEMWGPKNKLAVHVPSGVPVDFFATRPAFWYNYLVCRTGGAETNTTIAMAAQARGLKWHPYQVGFTVEDLASVLRWLAPIEGLPLSAGLLTAAQVHTSKMIPCHAEADVFACAGLAYLEPEKR